MTNRYRAGQPADLSQSHPSECASSGCNWPEGDCLGLCTLRSLEKFNAMSIQFAGPEPEEVSAILKSMLQPTQDEIEQMLARRRDEAIYGSSFSIGGKRIDPTSVYIAPIHTETPLRARIMDACADALDYVLDRLWIGAAVLLLGVAALVWSFR